MYKKSGVGYCLVITDTTVKNTTGRKGIAGAEIIIDTAFNPLQYTLNYAEVIQLPFSMGNMIIEQQHMGKPGYGPINLPEAIEQRPSYDLYAVGGVYKYKFINDIEQEIEIGDKAYFKPRSLHKKSNFMGMFKTDKGKDKYIYKVPYEDIFCVVRDEKIIMIGSYVLVEPIMEDYDDILIPTFSKIKDKDGNPIQNPKNLWIQKKRAPEHDNIRGFVRHVGSPLKGEVCDFESGMLVTFNKKTCSFQTIEGVKYIVMRQADIECELLEDVKVK